MLTPYLIEADQWSSEYRNCRDKIHSKIDSLGSGLSAELIQELSDTLEIVNSYYSNSMEGNPTRIGEIFSAREGKFEGTSAERDYQLEHVAHLAVSRKMRELLDRDNATSPVQPRFLRMLHREFYETLPESMRVATKITGETVPIIPGEWRTLRATVGRFQAPRPDQIAPGLEEFENAYSSSHVADQDRLTALAASHHRLLWIHPFADGNGRVARLFTEAMLRKTGYDGHSLYSIARGLARRRKEYDQALAAADAPRWNDFDGRGSLSLKGLVVFCEFFLDVMRDQIEFMSRLLDRDRTESRFQTQLHAWKAGRLLSESERTTLLHLFKVGKMQRGQIQRIANVERRQASKIASHLLSEGLVQSDSPKGWLRLKINKEIARALFPEFFE